MLAQLLSSSHLWRELLFGISVGLVVIIRWNWMRRRGAFVIVSLLLCEFMSRLFDVAGGASSGWRTLSGASVAYDFVDVLAVRERLAIGLMLTYLFLPCLVAFMKPFRLHRFSE